MLMKQLDTFLSREETFWQQRSWKRATGIQSSFINILLIADNGTKYWVFFMEGAGGRKMDQVSIGIILTNFLHQVTLAMTKTYLTLSNQKLHTAWMTYSWLTSQRMKLKVWSFKCILLRPLPIWNVFSLFLIVLAKCGLKCLYGHQRFLYV